MHLLFEGIPGKMYTVPMTTDSEADTAAQASRPIRVLALMEANSATGPAKNLIEFSTMVRRGTDVPAIEIALATFLRGAQTDSPFIAAAEASAIQVYRLHERWRFDAAVRAQLRTIVERYRPDIVQSHNVKSHALVRWMGLYREYPWVAFNHGYTATNLKDTFYNQFDRWSLRKAYRVVAVCESFAEKLARRGITKPRIRVQHNSVAPFVRPPLDAIQAVRSEFSLDQHRIVLCLGRLSREKGHVDLLTATALLRHRRPDLRFRVILVGDGPQRSVLLAQRAQLGLEDTVILAGFRSNVAPYYAIADVMALPSHSEGSPNVVLEAMSAGVPIVATAVGGVLEMLENACTGLLVPKQDPPALATAIETVLCQPTLAAGFAAAAQCRAGTIYSRSAYARRMALFYQEVVGSWRSEFGRESSAEVQ